MAKKKYECQRKAKQQYYQENRTEILKKMYCKYHNIPYVPPTPKICTKTLTEVLKEWNEQLSRKLQEDLPVWLKKGIEDQITINMETIQRNEKTKKGMGL